MSLLHSPRNTYAYPTCRHIGSPAYWILTFVSDLTTGPALAEPPIQSAKKAAQAGVEALPEAAFNRQAREDRITKCASQAQPLCSTGPAGVRRVS